MTSGPQPVPGIIVVAEQEVFDLLSASNVGWNTQHRAATVSQMWDDLSGGRLDNTSKALVFSDRLPGGLEETATAIAAMAPYAAVFVVQWQPGQAQALRDAVAAAAVAGGDDPASVTYYPVSAESGRSILESLRQVLEGTYAFPEQYPSVVDAPLTATPAPSGRGPWNPQDAAPTPPPQPPVPPVGGPGRAPAMPSIGSTVGDVPVGGGDAALLAQPPRPGQVTITVTSSKGGAGKSTSAALLASMIARSSAAAGRPLKVVLVDMDTRDGQVASMINKYMPTALNIRVQPVWDEETIKRHLVHADRLGIDCLLAPVRPKSADNVGPEFYATIIASLKRTHDVVVMDTSVQYLDPLISTVCLPEATAILFVTTLATTSVQGMARALREITSSPEEGGMGVPREKIGIVVNQSIGGVGMDRDQVVHAGLGVPVVGSIPLASKDVLTATNINRMDALVLHKHLGPAYFRLAQTCLPNAALAPLPWEGDEGVTAPPPAVDAAAQPVHQPDVVAPQGEKKRRLFGRG